MAVPTLVLELVPDKLDSEQPTRSSGKSVTSFWT